MPLENERMELVALRVKVYLGAAPPDAQGRVGNRWVYPDLDAVPSDLRGNVDWTAYIDRFGTMLYDNVCDFNEIDDYNTERGMKYAAFLVPPEFADAAVARFPEHIEVLDETEFEAFHDGRVTVGMPEEVVQADTLNAIRAKHGVASGPLKATAAMSAFERNALDPDHPSPGIVRNTRKYWKDVKARRQVTIRPKPKR